MFEINKLFEIKATFKNATSVYFQIFSPHSKFSQILYFVKTNSRLLEFAAVEA